MGRKKKALNTTLNKRKRILELLKDGLTIPEVMEKTGCTYFQVYNVKRHRVKHTPKDSIPRKLRDGEIEEVQLEESANIEDFESTESFFEHQITVALNDLNKYKLPPGDRVKLLKEVLHLQKNLKVIQIESYIKSPNAILIVNIIKRLSPGLGDEQIIKLIEEEREKMNIAKSS